MRIRTRAIIGFSGLLAVTAVLVFVAISQVNSISEKLGVIKDINSVEQRFAINFRGSVHDRAIAVRDVVLVMNAREREQAIEEIRTLEEFYATSAKSLDKILAENSANATKELGILGRIKETEKKTLPIIDEIIRLKTSDQSEAALNLLLSDARPLFVTWLAQINEFIDLKEEMNQLEGQHVRETADGFGYFMIVALGVGILFGLSVGAWIIVSLKPLGQSTRIMQELAAGDLDVEIPEPRSMDEAGEILTSLGRFKSAALERVELEKRQEIAEQEMAIQRQADMKQLSDDFQASVGSVVETFSQSSQNLKVSSVEMNESASIASDRANSVSDAALEATDNVETVSDAARQLSSSIGEISAQVSKSNEIANQAVDKVEKTNALVASLTASAQRVGDVVDLISDIAEQTNLLALNATIEAARAGDAGKGFAVVASEVKNLATQTANATEDINRQISSIQSSTQAAADAMNGVTATINEINGISATVSAAVEEQSAATSEIAHNVAAASERTSIVSTNIAEVIQAISKTASTAELVQSASSELSSQSEMLDEKVESFVVSIRD